MSPQRAAAFLNSSSTEGPLSPPWQLTWGGSVPSLDPEESRTWEQLQALDPEVGTGVAFPQTLAHSQNWRVSRPHRGWSAPLPLGTPPLSNCTSQGLEQEHVGFAGAFSQTEGQGFLHLRTRALGSLDMRRKSRVSSVFPAELAVAFSLLLSPYMKRQRTFDDVLCQQTAAQRFPSPTKKLAAGWALLGEAEGGKHVFHVFSGQVTASKMCVGWQMEREHPVSFAINCHPGYSASLGGLLSATG